LSIFFLEKKFILNHVAGQGIAAVRIPPPADAGSSTNPLKQKTISTYTKQQECCLWSTTEYLPEIFRASLQKTVLGRRFAVLRMVWKYHAADTRS
jgi:hypothetical protein